MVILFLFYEISVDASLVKHDLINEVFTKPWSDFVGGVMLPEKKLGIKVCRSILNNVWPKQDYIKHKVLLFVYGLLP